MNKSKKFADAPVKILFPLDRVDDYPPFEVESVWAVRTADGMYRIDNIPFYIEGIALNDVVHAKRADDGVLKFDSIASTAGHSTLRVVFFDVSIQDEFYKKIEALGCKWEGAYEPSLIAIDIPPSSDLSAVLNILAAGCGKELLDYEEGILRQ